MQGRRTNRRGFTLIEVLAVIVILGILMIVLLPRLTGMLDSAKARETGVWIASIDAAAKEYENRFGDFPPSQFGEDAGPPTNQTNLGGEALVAALWSTKWSGATLAEDKFANTDGDEARKALTRFPDKALKELVDAWGNPIAYFHHRDYGRSDVYLVGNAESGEMEEQPAKAWMNPATKTWANSTTFQIVSAGQDAQFGTSDDITNFKRD